MTSSAADGAPALFVGHVNSLRETGGGVQVCNREYIATLREAGYALTVIPFDYHNSLAEKIRRRLRPRVFSTTVPTGLAETLAAALVQTGAQTIFFSLAVFPDLSAALRRSHPQVRQVLLSHGVESLDFCIEQRVRRRLGRENRSRNQAEQMLGGEFLDEVEQRRFVDGVLTLSSFEVEVEQWLGAPKALWVPRTIMEPQLLRRMVDGRVGCVGTLNHPPNLDSLTLLFEALAPIAPSNFRFRLVGGPPAEGEAFAKAYPFIDYLGSLSDEALREEAETWCCFVHPMFLFAKGCSTKLAIALGWGLPIATTRYGVRGYVWDEAKAPLAASPAELARMTVERASLVGFDDFAKETAAIVAATPTLAGVGGEIAQFLDGL